MPLFRVEQAPQSTNLAKIAATWRASVSMVVTSESLISLRSAAGPPETLWPVLVHLLLVGVEFLLEFFFQFVGFGSQAIAPSHAVPTSRRCPGDQFQFSFVRVAILASAVTVVPLARRGYIGGR